MFAVSFLICKAVCNALKFPTAIGAGVEGVVEVLEEKRRIGSGEFSIGAPMLERGLFSVVKDVEGGKKGVRPRMRGYFGGLGGSRLAL
jgi:hypothetical protein